MSENLENNNLLARWLNNDLSEEEREQLAKTQGLDDLKAVVDDISTWKLPAVDIEKGLEEARKSAVPEKKSTISISMRPLMRYAAAIIFLAVAYFGGKQLFDPQNILVETGLSQHTVHELPDGSLVTLGPQSRLEYKKKNWEENRATNLIGQGFFDVEKGSTFAVATNLGTITVLGTEFDILEAGNKLAVNCFEGRVQVSVAGKQEILSALQGLIFNQGEIKRDSITINRPTWLSGRSTFSNAALSNVIIELKRYYDVDMTLPNQYTSLPFSGSFQHNDLAAALRSILVPLEITYSLSAEGKVVFD